MLLQQLMNLEATTKMATMTAAMMLATQQQEAALVAQQQQQQQQLQYQQLQEPSALLAIETLSRLAEVVLKQEEQLQHIASLGFAHQQQLQQQQAPLSPSTVQAAAAKPKVIKIKQFDSKKDGSKLKKKPCLKKKALRKNPELEWAQSKARMLSLEEIRKLKLFFTIKQKTANKMSGMKMTDISSHYIFQHGSKHDHSNFAKWLKNNRGRNGRGGTNLLLLLIWFRLSYGDDLQKAFQNIETIPAEEQTSTALPPSINILVNTP